MNGLRGAGAVCVSESQVSGEGVVGLLQDDASLNTESGAVADPLLSLQQFTPPPQFDHTNAALYYEHACQQTSIRRKEHSPETTNSKSLSSWG